jgi:hypothetical protein
MLQQSIHQTLLDTSSSNTREDPQQSVSRSHATPETEVDPLGFDAPDIFKAIDRLEERILNSPRVPLTGKTMVDEEALLEQIDAIRLSLPEVVTIAQEILQYKHQIVQEAQQQVQCILAEASQRAELVTDELGIVARSEQEAQYIRQQAIVECDRLRQQTLLEIEQARDCHARELERMRQEIVAECQQIQAGADEYADRVLHNMEYQLKDLIQAIQRGRHCLNRDAEALRIVTPPSELEVTSLSERLKEIGDCRPAEQSEQQHFEEMSLSSDR